MAGIVRGGFMAALESNLAGWVEFCWEELGGGVFLAEAPKKTRKKKKMLFLRNCGKRVCESYAIDLVTTSLSSPGPQRPVIARFLVPVLHFCSAAIVMTQILA